jgi:hypothetical protein
MALVEAFRDIEAQVDQELQQTRNLEDDDKDSPPPQ